MDFYRIFLDYFKKCVQEHVQININEMLEMAKGNENSANSALQELINNDYVTIKQKMNVFQPGTRLENLENITLNEKGYKELLNQIESEQLTEIAKFKALTPDSEFNSSKMEQLIEHRQQIIKENNEPQKESKDDVKKLSTEEKYHLIKKEILVFFYELSLEPCLLFDDEGNLYTLYKIRGKLHDIVGKYFKSSTYHLKYILNECLFQKGLIKYRFGKEYVKNNEEIGIKNFITDKGMKYLEEKYSFCPNKTLGELTEKEYISTYGNIVPRISSTLSKLAEGPAGLSKQLEKHFKLFNNIQKYTGLNSTALKLVQQWENSPSLKAARDAAATYSHIVGNTPYLKAVAGIQNVVPSNVQKVSNEFVQNQNFDSKDLNEESDLKNNKFYTFEGILGQNCGEVVTPTSEDSKRIQEKGFKVENGIKVLRGFTNSAILAFASQKDENYQRKENPDHLNAIEKFVENMRTSAKYLPEVTLIARGYEKLEKINLSGTLSEKQRGELENLEYYKLTVSEGNLYRIDGNHRLEALKKDNYYIPFSIIIWENVDINPDDEAFLFYFLNNKAKKLTTEENLKGLVNATTWKPHELLEANKYLPHLQYLEGQIQTSKFLSSYFCNNEPIKNIAEILEKIEDNIEFNQFQKIISLTNELLIHDKWNRLKIFDFYCQLVFYIAYKISDKKVCLSVLDNINSWVKKYKFDNTTFDNPIMLYKSAERTNNTRPIKVFIAMPYYDDEIIEDVNDQCKKLSEELITKYPLLENRFEIYEVMNHRGYEIDIQNQIMEQIKSAGIFIADVSEHICKKGTKTVDCHANPNVMYELGLAKGQPYTEIILLKNKNDKIEVPSDIITKYYNKFEFDKKVSMRKKLFEAIENILKDKFEII